MKRLNRLYFVRHGQTNGYENFPIYGHTDVDLTETGMVQMQRLAERLRFLDIRTIYCSDLKRSVQGARIIAQYHDVPIHSLSELREMYFGDWEGLTLGEIREQFPEELNRRQADLVNYRPPGQGESVEHLAQRVTHCLSRILSENEGDDILIVGHGGLNRVILCNSLGLDLAYMFKIHQDFGCLNIIDYYSESTLVRLVNG